MKTRFLTAALAFLCLLSPALRASAEFGEAEEPSIRIAFIDSGVSTRHLDPAHVEEGLNLVFPEHDTQDRIGHGTATAGLVLGSEEQGVTGVCPEALILPLVVMDVYSSGVVNNGGTEALCRAIRTAVDRDCRIINVSLASGEDTEELRSAVAFAEERGVLIVSAVGNGGEDGAPCYPANYESVLAVGTAENGAPADFSQNGADLLVEGVRLRVPTQRNTLRPATVSGTSYSCALLTGFCARLLLRYPSLRPAALRTALFALAEDVLESGYDRRSGWGVLPATPELPEPFPDLKRDWSYPGIVYAVERGLMNGVGDGRFAPSDPTTRAMLVTMLWRLAGAPDAGTADFIDVSPEAWYAPAVAWAAAGTLVSGYDSEHFGPEDELSREQLAVILWRYAARPEACGSDKAAELGAFRDAEGVSPWAEDAMAWAVETGLITGTGNGTLSPEGPATRAQIATILQRFDQAIP